MALVHRDRGEIAAARRALERARELDPDVSWVRSAWAELEASRKAGR